MLKRLSLGLAAIASLAAGFYLHSVRLQSLDPLAAAKYLPDRGVVVSAWLVLDRHRWSQLSNFGTPETKKYLLENAKTLERLLNDRVLVDLEFSRDIAPIFGSLTIAAIENQDSRHLDWLIVAPIADLPLFYWKLALKTRSNVAESYRGSQLYAISRRGGAKFWAVKIDNDLLISSSKENLYRSIDAVSGNNLALQASFMRSKVVQDKPLLEIYLPNYRAFDPKINSLAASLGMQPQGLQLEHSLSFPNPNFKESDRSIYRPQGSIASVRANNGAIAGVALDLLGWRGIFAREIGVDLGKSFRVSQSSWDLVAVSNKDLGVAIFVRSPYNSRLLSFLDLQGFKRGYRIVSSEIGSRKYKSWLSRKGKRPFFGYGVLDSQTAWLALGTPPALKSIADSQIEQTQDTIQVNFGLLASLLDRQSPPEVIDWLKSVDTATGKTVSDADGLKGSWKLNLRRLSSSQTMVPQNTTN